MTPKQRQAAYFAYFAYFARIYRERAALNLCAEGRCANQRAPGRVRCAECLDYQRKKYLTRSR